MDHERSRLYVISDLGEQLLKALLEKSVGPGHAARMYESRPAAFPEDVDWSIVDSFLHKIPKAKIVP